MRNLSSSVYLRFPFEVPDPKRVDRLELHLRYDDGVVVYLNGEELFTRNAPAPAQWNSTATARHEDADAIVFEEFDLADFLDLLRPGSYVLAIQGLNLASA